MNPEDYTGRLEGWKWDPVYNIIWGFVYDDIHGRFVDGTWIHTSSIKRSEFKDAKQGDKVRTLNSVYLLGEPSLIGE